MNAFLNIRTSSDKVIPRHDGNNNTDVTTPRLTNSFVHKDDMDTTNTNKERWAIKRLRVQVNRKKFLVPVKKQVITIDDFVKSLRFVIPEEDIEGKIVKVFDEDGYEMVGFALINEVCTNDMKVVVKILLNDCGDDEDIDEDGEDVIESEEEYDNNLENYKQKNNNNKRNTTTTTTNENKRKRKEEEEEERAEKNEREQKREDELNAKAQKLCELTERLEQILGREKPNVKNTPMKKKKNKKEATTMIATRTSKQVNGKMKQRNERGYTQRRVSEKKPQFRKKKQPDDITTKKLHSVKSIHATKCGVPLLVTRGVCGLPAKDHAACEKHAGGVGNHRSMLTLDCIKPELCGKWVSIIWTDTNEWYDGKVMELDVAGKVGHAKIWYPNDDEDAEDEEEEIDLIEAVRNNEVSWNWWHFEGKPPSFEDDLLIFDFKEEGAHKPSKKVNASNPGRIGPGTKTTKGGRLLKPPTRFDSEVPLHCKKYDDDDANKRCDDDHERNRFKM